MLQQLKLKIDRIVAKSEVGTVDFDDGRSPDVRPNQPLGGFDFRPINHITHHLIVSQKTLRKEVLLDTELGN